MAIYLTDDNGELHKIAGSGGGNTSGSDVKVIYDMYSDDAELNWGYPNGIKSSTEIIKSFSNDRVYRIYFVFGGDNSGVCMTSKRFSGGPNNFAGGTTIRSISSGSACEISIVLQPNLLKPIFYLRGTERINDDTYVYRIEEIVEGSGSGAGSDANVEHCELVYDKQTKPVPLGSTTAYNTGIWGTVNMDLSKYKFIRAYFGHNGGEYNIIINCEVGYNGGGVILDVVNGSTFLNFATVKCTTTSFTLLRNGYFNASSMGSFNDRTGGYNGNNPENYSVRRIEGVY